jgi:hypothetical protein
VWLVPLQLERRPATSIGAPGRSRRNRLLISSDVILERYVSLIE